MKRSSVGIVACLLAAAALMIALWIFASLPRESSGYAYPGTVTAANNTSGSWNGYGNMMAGALNYPAFGALVQLNQSQLHALLLGSSVSSVSNNTLVFSGDSVRVVVLMGPMQEGTSMYSFVIDNLTNPTLVFQHGANVIFYIVNVDTDAYHSLALSEQPPPYPYEAMPMMMYSYATSMMLPPTSGAYYGERINITVNSGMYYLCTVPGHAQDGMYGRIQVE